MPTLTHFYCENCGQWTAHREYTDDEREEICADDGYEVNPVCGRCWEPYQCGECGYEIDHEGNCLREEGHDS